MTFSLISFNSLLHNSLEVEKHFANLALTIHNPTNPCLSAVMDYGFKQKYSKYIDTIECIFIYNILTHSSYCSCDHVNVTEAVS